MKKLSLFASIAAMGATAYAGPLLQVGDDLDVSFIGSVIGKWSNNVTWSSSNTIDDYCVTTRVGGEAVYGKNKAFTLTAKAYEDLNRYLQHERFDSNLTNVFVNATYQGDAFNANAHFSFVQSAQNTDTTINGNDLARSNLTKAGIKGSYVISNKVVLDAGFDFIDTHYTSDRDLYTDSNAYIVPVSLLYKVTDKLSAGLSYQYRQTNYDDGTGSEESRKRYGDRTRDHFIGLTLRGDLTEKLSSEIYVGATVRDSSGVEYAGVDNDDTAFTFSAKFNYQASDKANFYVKGLRDFGNGAQRQSSESTGVDFGVNYILSSYITSFAYGGYRYVDYVHTARQDDKLFAGVGVSYAPVNWGSISLSYTYYDNASSISSASYMSHIVSASLSIKY